MKRQDSSGQERRDGYNPVAQHAGLLSEVNSLSSFSPLPGLAAWLFNSYRTTRSAPQSFSSALHCFLFPPESSTDLCH